MEALTWGALIAAAGSLILVAKFWMDMGAANQKASDAASMAQVMAAKLELLTAQLAEHKIHVASNYATVRALNDTEAALAQSMERAVQGIYSRLDKITERLDSWIALAKHPH